MYGYKHDQNDHEDGPSDKDENGWVYSSVIVRREMLPDTEAEYFSEKTGKEDEKKRKGIEEHHEEKTVCFQVREFVSECRVNCDKKDRDEYLINHRFLSRFSLSLLYDVTYRDEGLTEKPFPLSVGLDMVAPA